MRKQTSPAILVLWIFLGLAVTAAVLHAGRTQPMSMVPLAMAMPAVQGAPAAPMMVAMALPPAEEAENNAKCSADMMNFGDDIETFRAEESRIIAAPASLDIESARNGPLKVRGTDRSDVAITICKVVGADSDTEARTLLSQVRLVTEGGRISVTGPEAEHWSAALIVEVPRAQTLSANGQNGPMSLKDLGGQVNVRVHNGPLAMDRVTGTLHAEANNGPVSLKHGAGDVEINANNGPLDVELTGPSWNGHLTASTHNGPLQVRLPKGFASGVEVDSGNGPFACNLDSCGELSRSRPGEGQHVKIGGDPVVVHLRADHGPVAIGSNMD